MDECVLRIDSYEGRWPKRSLWRFVPLIVILLATWVLTEQFSPGDYRIIYSLMFLVVVCSLMGISLMLILRCRRNLHQRVILTNHGIVMPAGRWSRESQFIDYLDIESISREKVLGLESVIIHHIDDSARLFALQFPSDANYRECVDLLFAKFHECKLDEWNKDD